MNGKEFLMKRKKIFHCPAKKREKGEKGKQDALLEKLSVQMHSISKQQLWRDCRRRVAGREVMITELSHKTNHFI